MIIYSSDIPCDIVICGIDKEKFPCQYIAITDDYCTFNIRKEVQPPPALRQSHQPPHLLKNLRRRPTRYPSTFRPMNNYKNYTMESNGHVCVAKFSDLYKNYEDFIDEDEIEYDDEDEEDDEDDKYFMLLPDFIGKIHAKIICYRTGNEAINKKTGKPFDDLWHNELDGCSYLLSRNFGLCDECDSVKCSDKCHWELFIELPKDTKIGNRSDFIELKQS